MITVRQILAGKECQDVCTIGPDRTVYEAVKVFADHNLGALIVTEQSRLLGVFTERDYARKIALMGRSSQTTTVRDVMTTGVISVTPDDNVEDCMALMINKYIRHLPVLDDHLIIGVISMGDVVKSMLGEKAFLIDELTRYITDSRQTPSM